MRLLDQLRTAVAKRELSVHYQPKVDLRSGSVVGVEALGVDDPALDVEVIALLDGFYRDLGLTGVTLHLNSMGDAESRPGYLAALTDYLLGHAGDLGQEFRERVEASPLRVLDTKVPEWQDVVERAPQLTEHLSDASFAHFEQVQEGLQALGIKYELAPRLVRGFDYYTRTTFEFQSDALDAAQNALGGGGRYDGLAESLGGPATPGIGFGSGIERVLLTCDAEGVATIEASTEAEEEWFNLLMTMVGGLAVYNATCTPGYLNGEQGEPSMKAARNSPYMGSMLDYARLLEAWRAEGSLAGAEIARA